MKTEENVLRAIGDRDIADAREMIFDLRTGGADGPRARQRCADLLDAFVAAHVEHVDTLGDNERLAEDLDNATREHDAGLDVCRDLLDACKRVAEDLAAHECRSDDDDDNDTPSAAYVLDVLADAMRDAEFDLPEKWGNR